MNKVCGMLDHDRRAIIFAASGTDFAERAGEVAKEYKDEMSQYLSAAGI